MIFSETKNKILDPLRIYEPSLGLTFIRKTQAETNATRHFHSWWEIVYIKSGERKFFILDKTIRIRKGMILITPPGVLHRALNVSREKCSIYNIYFNVKNSECKNFYIEDLEIFLKQCEIPIQFNEEAIGDIENLFLSIENELIMQKEGFVQMVWSLFSKLIITCARSKNEFIIGQENIDTMKKIVYDAIQFVNNNYDKNCSLPYTAKKIGVSAAHLSREFHRTTHFTFIEYVNNIRIMNACKFLVSTNDTVANIAMKCGFGSITQFGRCFRSITETSAIKYRQIYKTISF